MTTEQVVVNSKCVLAAAARLEARGWQGPDAAAFVEGLLLEAIRSGYKPVDPPPALRGPTSTAAGRAAARKLFEETRQPADRSKGMSEYGYDDETTTEAAEPEDERVTAMREMVDRERYMHRANEKVDQYAKEAEIARQELASARDRLNGLLGLPSNAKARSYEGAINVGANR